MSPLREKYLREVVPALQKRFSYRCALEVPRLSKIVLNMGVGDALQNEKLLDSAVAELRAISGQQPVVTRAKKSVASFKLRAGDKIGVMVTLRGDRMYDFLQRLILLALPRVRDFRGLDPDSFDGRGNYTLGIREQLIFPEVDYDQVQKVRGLEVSLVTTARTDEEARELLRLLGMPFRQAA
jgi:large subunit ribosomal protein L5